MSTIEDQNKNETSKLENDSQNNEDKSSLVTAFNNLDSIIPNDNPTRSEATQNNEVNDDEYDILNKNEEIETKEEKEEKIQIEASIESLKESIVQSLENNFSNENDVVVRPPPPSPESQVEEKVKEEIESTNEEDSSNKLHESTKDSFEEIKSSVEESKVEESHPEESTDEHVKDSFVEIKPPAEESKAEESHSVDASDEHAKESFVDLKSPAEDEAPKLTNAPEEEHTHDSFVDVKSANEGIDKEVFEEDLNKSPVVERTMTVSGLNVLSEEVENNTNNNVTASEGNVEDIKEPFEEIKVEEEEDPVLDILGNGTLVKKVLKRGELDKRAKNGQICTISYKLRLESNLEEIIEEQISFQFVLGDGDVVPALDIAVSLMNLGEVCELKSESRHAYGEKGDSTPNVPANATIVYTLTLENFQIAPELKQLETIERLSLAESKKKRGNYYYNRQSYEQALSSYKKGLKFFLDYNLSGNESKEDLNKINDIKAAIYMNVALSNYKLQSNADALEALDNVLKHQDNHVKALFIKGKISFHIGELDDAIKCFKKALEIQENPDILKELGRAQAKHKIQYAKEKEMYQKMISGVGAIPESTKATATSASGNSGVKNKNSKSEKASNSNNNNNLFSYLATAGVIFAIASIGIAAYVKYKNLI